MQTCSIFLDGRMVKAEETLIESLAPGIVEGDGVFETMRVINGTIFALDGHFDRLLRGLKAYRIRSPYSREKWAYYLYRTIRMNALKDAAIRLAVWKEKKRLRIAIVCRDIGAAGPRHGFKGYRVLISSIVRKKTRFAHVKSMDYCLFRRAFEEARRKGYDEAILLNSSGEIVEGSRSNVFFVKSGVLYTPKIVCGCLNGITRQLVIRLAGQLKIPVKRVLAVSRQIVQADEAFLTNSLIGVKPVVAVNRKAIGKGKAGPLTEKLISGYETRAQLSCLTKIKSL